MCSAKAASLDLALHAWQLHAETLPPSCCIYNLKEGGLVNLVNFLIFPSLVSFLTFLGLGSLPRRTEHSIPTEELVSENSRRRRLCLSGVTKDSSAEA